MDRDPNRGRVGFAAFALSVLVTAGLTAQPAITHRPAEVTATMANSRLYTGSYTGTLRSRMCGETDPMYTGSHTYLFEYGHRRPHNDQRHHRRQIQFGRAHRFGQGDRQVPRLRDRVSVADGRQPARLRRGHHASERQGVGQGEAADNRRHRRIERVGRERAWRDAAAEGDLQAEIGLWRPASAGPPPGAGQGCDRIQASLKCACLIALRMRRPCPSLVAAAGGMK